MGTPASHEMLRIKIEGRLHAVALRRHSRARRVGLRFDALTKRFFLILPLGAPLSDALTFLDRQRGWMQACLEKSETYQENSKISLIPGVEFPIRGELHCIRHDPKGRRRPRQEKNILWVGGPQECIPARIAAWLRDEAIKDLSKVTSEYAFRLEKNVISVTVRDTKSQWGSCTARGALSFSWRLILAPRLVLTYVAAHEAAHLVEMNHSSHFWALVSRLHPDPDWARRWLKQNSTGLHRYG